MNTINKEWAAQILNCLDQKGVKIVWRIRDTENGKFYGKTGWGKTGKFYAHKGHVSLALRYMHRDVKPEIIEYVYIERQTFTPEEFKNNGK